MKIFSKRTGILFLFTGLILLAVVFSSWAAPEMVPIGILVPQEENPLYVTKLKNAYQLAVMETAGRSTAEVRFFFQIIEYPRDPAKIKTTLEQAITGKKLKALVGGFSSADSQAIAEVAAKNSLPYLSIAYPFAVNKSEWVFYLQPSADQYAAALKGFATEEVKAKSLAVIYEDTPQGRALNDSLQKMAQANSWSYSGYIDNPLRAMTTQGFLQQLKAQTPDMLVMAYSSTDAVFLLRQAQQLDINPKALVGVGMVLGIQELADPAMKQSDYLFVVSPWVGNSKPKSVQHFAEAYQQRYGFNPHQWEALGYSAVRLMADAVLKAESASPKKIREALAGLKRGVSFGGEVRFGEAGGSLNQSRTESAVAQWQQGKLLLVYPDKYREAKPLLPTPKWSERK